MGNVNVNGGALEWTAVLDDGGIDQALNGLNQKFEDSARRQQQQADQSAKAQQQYVQTIIQTGQAFKNLDATVQGQFRTLSQLLGEFQKVEDAKNELTRRKDLGIIGADTAESSMISLLAKERELSLAIEKVSQDMQTSDAIMRAASGSIVQRTLQLQALKKEYEGLSETDRNNASIGGGLLTKIQGIDAELKAINQSYQQVEQHALGSINEKTSALAKVKQEYSALAETDRNSDIGKGMLSNIQRLEKEVEVLNNSFKAVPQNAVGSLNAKVAQITELKNRYAELSEIDRKSDIGKNLAKNIKGLDKEIQKINSEFNTTNDLASKAALAIGSFLTLNAATGFIKDIVRVRGEFQQLEVAFNTILGSKEKADKLMGEVVNLAATTPFTLQEVATGSKQLLAYGFAADTVVSNLKMLGDVAAGVGAPLGDIVYLYGTLQTQGRAYTKDIMQFTSRGIPIIDELAKQFGVTKEKVQDLVEAGKVGFPEVEKAFQSLTGQGGIFFNLMDAQSKTLTGQLSNLSDAWSQMLNDIGKSNEGIFSGAISAATSLVNNYQKVLDILKVLVATYGTYKAAVIATTVAQAIQTAATQGYTIIETLRYRAMLISEAAMRLLNKTMLANPYVAVATGVAALVTAFVVFGKTASNVKDKAHLLAEAQKEVGDRLSETQAKIQPYLEALKGANVTEQQRVDIYNKLAAIDPKIVEGLNAKTLSYQTLATNVNKYLDALRKQIALEANGKALQGSIQAENDISSKIAKDQKILDFALQKQKEGFTGQVESTRGYASSVQEAITLARIDINKLTEDLNAQKKVSEDLGKTQLDSSKKQEEVKKRTVEIIDQEIADLQKQQKAVSDNRKTWLEFDEKIKKLQEERTNIAGESKKEIAAGNALENKTNSILEERKNLLEAINGLKRDAFQSGLTKEQSELDKVNEKYDIMIDRMVEFNKKAEQFNAKNKTNVQGFGLVDLATVNDTRVKELGNTALIKQGSEGFKSEISAQKKIFEDFQQAVKEIGVEKAQEIFGEQTKGFDSFLAYLQAEAKKNINLINPEKVKAINEEINNEEKKNEEELFKEKYDNYKRLISATADFTQQRLAYEKQYWKDVVFLAQNFSGKELEERLKVLKEAKDADLKSMAESLAQQSEGFRTLHKEAVKAASDRINQEIALLEQQLNNPNLDKATKTAIKAAINQWRDLLHAIDGTDDKVNKFASDANKVASIFNSIGTAVQGLNAELGQTLQTIGGLVSGVANAKAAFAKFADEREKLKSGSGDILNTISAGAGAVGGALSVGLSAISLVDSIVTKAQEKKLQQYAQEQQNLLNVYKGELAINELYRQRELEQIKLNKLRLQGINDETAALLKQKTQVQDEFNDLISKIQKEFKNTPGFFPRNAANSLQGLNYDQLEKLFLQNQLSDKAKQLFEELQKLKQEGVDIDKQLQDLQEQAKEIFTGTTGDAIVDSIADGFKNGLHSAADFAGTFEDLMRNAMLSSLKFQYLEPALKNFFDEFAKASESDNTLTASEIDNLKNLFNTSITDFDKKLQQFQQISGINLNSGTGATTNSLTGAIRAMTEDTAELLAGQMGGLRLTAIDTLAVSKKQLDAHLEIQNNTAQAVVRLDKMYALLYDVTTGTKKFKIQ